MSSSKTSQKRSSAVSSCSSSSSQLPTQHFFSASFSSSSAPITEVHSTSVPLKQHRQKRSKDEGRWFPTPRPRYNSDGKKMNQGSSYPYPSGGNRLPFAKRKEEGERVWVRGGKEEVDFMWACEKDRERHDRVGGDTPTETETKKGKDKVKGKDKAVERRVPDGTRAEDYDTTLLRSQAGRMQLSRKTPSPLCRPVAWATASPPSSRSKRRTGAELPKESRTTTRRDCSPERKHLGENNGFHQPQRMSFSQEPFEDQDQQPEDNEPEIKYTQLDGHPEARPPFFTESSYAVGPYTSRPAWFMPHELGDPFVGIGRYSDNFEARYNSFSFGIHPHPYSKSLFSSLEMNENMPFADCRVINDLETLFYSSRTYYPWSGYDAGPRGELPAALNEYQSFVAELKRTVLPIPRSSSPSVGANEQLMNDLRAEHSRFMCELSVLRELKGPLLRLVEATRLEYWDGPDELRVLAVEENDRLKVYRRMLLQWLREVEDEMNEGLDMYQLSLEEDDEQYRPQESSEKQCHWHHRLHCDQDLSQSQFARHMETEEEKKVVREAKAQLQEYNRRWAEILSRPPSTSHCTSTALAQPISIPYPYISKSSPSPEIPETTSISQAWASHTFFRHAFNLSPYLEPPPANLPLSPPQFAFSTSGSPERQMRDLMGLRNQLKMEKVRWHEDRLKAVFGAEAAREERAKGVWGVVIDLKRGVDEALELLESG